MDVNKILEELRQERQQIEEAILSLERLASGRGRRRGRPPSWMVEARMREADKEKEKEKDKARGVPQKAAKTSSAGRAAAT